MRRERLDLQQDRLLSSVALETTLWMLKKLDRRRRRRRQECVAIALSLQEHVWRGVGGARVPDGSKQQVGTVLLVNGPADG